MAHLDDVYTLDEAQQAQVLAYLPRIANIVAHIVDERKALGWQTANDCSINAAIEAERGLQTAECGSSRRTQF